MPLTSLLSRILPVAVVATSVSLAAENAPSAPPNDGLPPPEETEYWSPVPKVIQAPADGIPSDAIVLFDGKNLDAWESEKTPGEPAPWKLVDGAAVVVPKAGGIKTKQAFGDVQLHVEWRTPTEIVGKSQGRGNSGVFLMGLYEVQVLDSYENPTYVNGQAGSVYKQHPPLVNVTRKPGEWQTYDIIWEAPRFGADGKLTRPAYVTVLHNGVLVQNHSELTGPTQWRGKSPFKAHPAKLPLALQEHGNPVQYRNIWIRELSLPEKKQ